MGRVMMENEGLLKMPDIKLNAKFIRMELLQILIF